MNHTCRVLRPWSMKQNRPCNFQNKILQMDSLSQLLTIQYTKIQLNWSLSTSYHARKIDHPKPKSLKSSLYLHRFTFASATTRAMRFLSHLLLLDINTTFITSWLYIPFQQCSLVREELYFFQHQSLLVSSPYLEKYNRIELLNLFIKQY